MLGPTAVWVLVSNQCFVDCDQDVVSIAYRKHVSLADMFYLEAPLVIWHVQILFHGRSFLPFSRLSLVR